MSLDPIIIREGNYYGGDLTVTWHDANRTWGACIEIAWEAWGDYGAGAIRLKIDEAERLAEALPKMLESIPDWSR